MTSVIPVKFAYAVRDLWFSQNGTDAQEGDHVICSTERGTEIGLATGSAREVSDEELSRTIGNSKLKPVLRIATDADLAYAEELAQMGEDAYPAFRRLATASGLDMKPVGVEYLFGGEKVVCYFAAEERVDFRQLVRDLSHELHQRIDMRQIGVREEAAHVGGFGHCGQELCCSRFGLSFDPVSIRMAKEQDLPLTSNKISGACGRLMCCLRYEFEAYRDFKGRAPKRNAVIDTPLGKAKIVEYDTPKEQLALRLESGKVVRIPLAEMVTSDAAVKKSEELNCPCRPDTVVRASLDKLTAPEVQMALAELDRKMGVVHEESFDAMDIVVEAPQPRKRRSRRHGADAGSGAATAAGAKTGGGANAGAGSGTGANQQTGGKPAQGKQTQKAAAAAGGGETTEKRTRRRRHKRSGADEQAAQLTANAANAPVPAPVQNDAGAASTGSEKPKETRRRRRHRTANAANDAPASQTQEKQPTQQRQQRQKQKKQQAQTQQQQEKPTRTKRRPGDRGGQKAQQQTQQPSQQTQSQTQQQGEGAAKRRRRRRRRSNSGGEPSAE